MTEFLTILGHSWYGSEEKRESDWQVLCGEEKWHFSVLLSGEEQTFF